jgi:hypothetical protein
MNATGTESWRAFWVRKIVEKNERIAKSGSEGRVDE